MIGFVDESMRWSGEGLYVVACVVVVKRRVAEIREEVRGLLLPGQEYLHWRDESTERQEMILKAIGSMATDVMAITYFHMPTPKTGQIRARTLCLQGLLWELRNTGRIDLVIESRGSQDAADRTTIAQAIRAKQAPARLVYRFASKTEPLLWLPDAVAGAEASEIAGEGRGHGELLRDVVLDRKAVLPD